MESTSCDTGSGPEVWSKPTVGGELTATRLSSSVAFCGELELAGGTRIAFETVIDGSVALDRSSLGLWRGDICDEDEDEDSRRWPRMASLDMIRDMMAIACSFSLDLEFQRAPRKR